MQREQLTEKIIDIKRAKGWSWKHITTEIGGVSPSSSWGRCSVR
jgi:cyanate lyase